MHEQEKLITIKNRSGERWAYVRRRKRKGRRQEEEEKEKGEGEGEEEEEWEKKEKKMEREKKKIRAIIDILSKQPKFYLIGYKYGSEWASDKDA